MDSRPVSTALAERLRRRVSRVLGPYAGCSVVVAVSGGSDSVALLRLAAELALPLGLRIHVAHFHHGVRGADADGDACFVAGLADALGFNFHLAKWAPQRSGHFEEDAREARYGWLRELAAKEGAKAVAVGHTRDDQAETILHRILRGTGPDGLAGIPKRRLLAPGIALVRPLLTASRAELQEYLSAIGQSFRVDCSNEDTARTRARLRQELLPGLARDYNPRVVDALIRLGSLSARAAGGRRIWAQSVLDLILLARDDSTLRLCRQRLASLPQAIRMEVLRLAWQQQNWPLRDMSARRWMRLSQIAACGQGESDVNTEQDVPIGAGIEVKLSASEFILSRPERMKTTGQIEGARHESAVVVLAVPGTAIWGSVKITVTVPPEEPCDEVIDLLSVVLPLRITGPLPGDRFEPLGMKGHGMPLSAFLRGRGFGQRERPGVPILRDSLGILWVVGHRIAERVRRKEDQGELLGLSCQRLPITRSTSDSR